MIRRPPRSTRTDTLFPYTTLFRSSAYLYSQIMLIKSTLPFYWPVKTGTPYQQGSSHECSGLPICASLVSQPVDEHARRHHHGIDARPGRGFACFPCAVSGLCSARHTDGTSAWQRAGKEG